jgi:NAD(P)-dependent dehydrogenase (short-subunit alcohol dehydrogenase family)
VFDLHDRVALITGGSRGLGREIALAYAQHGATVVVASRKSDACAAAAQEISATTGRRALGIACHVGNWEQCDALVDQVYEELGRIDVLVNNAGIGQASLRSDQRRTPLRFWEVTPEQWQQFQAVNATSPVMMARAVVPHMLKAGRGRIITVTTSLGTMVREGYLLYGANKATAEAAMAILAADLAGTGVTSNVLVPGGVTDTPLVGEAGDRSKMLRPEIMVPPLLWLVSDEAERVTARRFIAADWDTGLSPAAASEKAGAPIAWLGIARMPIEPG